MSRYALGIDIGGTKIAAGIVDPDGHVSHRHVISTPAAQGAASVLAAVIDVSHHVLAVAHDSQLVLTAIGVGTAGHVDSQRGVITYASGTLPGWSGTPVRDELERAFSLPVAVENDVNAFALGERCWGAGRAFRHALYVTVGTGVGGALIHDGRLCSGATWTAGELGHLVIDWDGERRCSCGRLGHLEAYASGPAIAARYRLLSGLDDACDLRSVAERARAGDFLATSAIEEGAHILGLALGGLLNVLDPEALIVGGGVTKLDQIWWPAFEAALRANALPGPARIALQRAELGDDAVLAGAAWLALTEHQHP